MHHAIRSQTDLDQDFFSLSSGLECDPAEDKARPEFAADADVNILLRKYGAVPQRPLVYGEVNFDLDLLSAYEAVSSAVAGYARLPLSVRERFPDMATLFAAMASGEVVDLHPTPVPAAMGSAAGGGVAPPAGPIAKGVPDVAPTV